jgi:Alpha mannosidase middle domain
MLQYAASSFLLAARQIDALAPIIQPDSLAYLLKDIRTGALYPLEDAVSIAQHHDAVAGTAKQHVADDYSKKLSFGINVASQHTIYQLKQRTLMMDDEGSQLDNLSYCPLLNESICEISFVSTTITGTHAILVQVPLLIFVFNVPRYRMRLHPMTP